MLELEKLEMQAVNFWLKKCTVARIHQVPLFKKLWCLRPVYLDEIPRFLNPKKTILNFVCKNLIDSNKIVMRVITSIFIVLLFQTSFGQKSLTINDSISSYFDEVKVATKTNKKLWDMNLYGPIIIVNPYTRQAYSNFPDSTGILIKEGKIFTGKLPGNILVGNYSLTWGGLNWAMVLTIFINNNKNDRVDLFTHELFHRAQPLLNFSKVNDQNNAHLDSKKGRIYIRLELEALVQALKSVDKNEKMKHILNALYFRKYRYELFPNAFMSEATIEINEGIASYTGKVMRYLNEKELDNLLISKITDFFKEQSYVQMFAYNTIAAYGFLLRETDKYWNKKVSSETNLTDFFISAFGFTDGKKQQINIDSLLILYNGLSIIEEETEREDRIKKTVLEYKKKFLEHAHFEITFEKKRISYDTRYIVTIEDLGYVYPTMKATDNWGVLDIKDGGGFLNPTKDKVILTIPTKIDGNNISGEGWTLQLNEDYTIFKDESTGNYTLKRK